MPWKIQIEYLSGWSRECINSRSVMKKAGSADRVPFTSKRPAPEPQRVDHTIGHQLVEVCRPNPQRLNRLRNAQQGQVVMVDGFRSYVHAARRYAPA